MIGLVDRRAQLAFGLVLLVLGFLLVVQFRSQSLESGFGRLSAQDLTVLVANLNARNDQLRTEVGDLEAQLVRVQQVVGSGQQATTQIRNELARDSAWAGLAGALGPGVTVAVSGPIPGVAVGDLLNELRNAGAEALTVGTVRVVAGTVVSGDGGALVVEGVRVADPLVVTALGNPDALTGSLTRPGGIVSLFAATYPGVRLSVTPLDHLAVPATTRNLAPAHGTPRL